MGQSLLKDFQSLAELIEQGVDITSTLAIMLSGISYDTLNAATSSAGSAIQNRRQVWLRHWKAGTAQKAFLMRIPFSGPTLFGAPLEEMIKTSVEDQKLLAPTNKQRKSFF